MRWNRTARWYNLLISPFEFLFLQRWRKRAVRAAATGGRLLEVGAGTGLNARFHPAGTVGVMTDLSIAMIAEAGRRTDIPRRVQRVIADVEHLPFREGSFEVTLATLVFCEVRDPLAGLVELRRVLAAGGTAVFLEHVRPQCWFLGSLFDALNAITSRFGEQMNRRSVEMIVSAGYRIQNDQSGIGTVIRLVSARR